jgi:hypothetical protein
MGAGKWRESYTETLRGARHVIVVADNDEPGRKHARTVAEAVRLVVDDLEVKRPALDAEHAGVDDHLAAGFGLQELLELEEEQVGDEEKPAADPFPVVDLDAFLSTPPAEPEWDWRGWYARGDVVLGAGDPGVGKSLVALGSAVMAANGGGELLGEPITARRALFFDLESPDDVVYQRLYAFGLRGNAGGFAYVHRPAYFNLLDSESFSRLRATIAATSAELVVIDSLRRAAPGLDENDSRDVSILFTALRDIAAELGCTIIVIHHPRKPVGDAKVEALYAARGSGDLIGSVDSYLFFRKLSGGLIRIEHGKARRGREHEPVCFRILEGEAGEPVIEHVAVEAGPEDEELYEAVVAYVREHPGEPQSAIEDEVEGSRDRVRKALLCGASNKVLARGPGRAKNGKYWYPADHAALGSPGDHGASGGEQPLWDVQEGVVAELAAAPKGKAAASGERPAVPGEQANDREEAPDGDIPW